MRSLQIRVLLLVGALAAGSAGIALVLLTGSAYQNTLMLPLGFVFVALVFAAVLLWLGSQVSKFRDQQRRVKARAMNPLLAARVAALAQATALTAAALLGWHLVVLTYQLSLVSARGVTSSTWTISADVLGSLLLLIAGLLVESKCKIPPTGGSDDDHTGTPHAEKASYAARQGRNSDR